MFNSYFIPLLLGNILGYGERLVKNDITFFERNNSPSFKFCQNETTKLKETDFEVLAQQQYCLKIILNICTVVFFFNP